MAFSLSLFFCCRFFCYCFFFQFVLFVVYGFWGLNLFCDFICESVLFVGVCVFMPSEDMGWVFVYWKHHVHISMCPSCVKKVFYLWECVLQQNNFQHSSMQGNPTPPITPQAAAGGYPPDIKPFQQDMKPRMMKRGEWQQCHRECWLDNENSGVA